MPRFSDDEIKAAIANGAIAAISIDTAIFDAKQKTFQNAVLRRLDQFHQRGVRVIIPDVIAKEMKAHLLDKALETQRELKKALRSHAKFWKQTEDSGSLEKQLLITSDATEFVESEFDAFLDHINGQIVNVSDTPGAVDKILARYFSKEPPFGSTDKRKSEFPDAFALFRLEAFAADQGKLLMCVAPDKAWVDFAAQSDHLICVSKLEDALALFNAADQHLADAIVQQWKTSEGGDLAEFIENAFEYRLDYLDFDVDGDSDVSFEAEPLSASLQHILPQTIGEPTVIATDGETVTFLVHLRALVGFEASFSFYVTDSIDKDYVDLGSEKDYVEKEIPFDLTITADRSLDRGPIFHEVEVARKPFKVNFGYVEAFPNEDPTHEKY